MATTWLTRGKPDAGRAALTIAETATEGWADSFAVIVCDPHDKMQAVAHGIASADGQLRIDRDDKYPLHRHSHGTLFLGSRIKGDRIIGTNHTLPTRKAGRHIDGPWMRKFLKTDSDQRLTPDASAALARNVPYRKAAE